MSSPRFRWFAALSLAWCLGVIVWGAYVRATGSGAGCGAHWPNCNGELVPRAPSTQTLIEFTHRTTSGLSLLSVVALVVWSRRLHAAGHAVRRAAAWSLGFMLSEALLGALLVKLELVANNATANRAVAMSLHLVNTFLLLASMTATVVWAWRGDGRVSWRGLSAWALGAAFFGTMVVAVTGAVTALGDTLHQQDVQNAFVDVLIRFRLLHPVLAIAGTLSVMGAAFVVKAHGPRVAQPWAAALVAAVLLQVVAGLVNVALAAPTFMQLIHLALADSVWGLLVVVSRLSLADRLNVSPNPSVASS